MKLFFLMIPVLLMFSNVNSQVEMDYGLFYFVHPEQEAKVYSNVLIISNCDFPTIVEMKKAVKKEGFNVYTQNELFPPLKNWSENEVDSIIRVKKIDGILHLNYLDISTITSNMEIGKYGPPTKFKPSMMNKNSPSNYETEVEGYFIDVENLEEYAFYCTGLVRGKPMPACYKSLYRITQKIKELNIAFVNEEEFDNFQKKSNSIPNLKSYINKSECIKMIDKHNKANEVIVLEISGNKIIYRSCDNEIRRVGLIGDILSFQTVEGELIYTVGAN